jgi:RNA polymerase sigma-70 factor (ECF subfamily)
MTSDSNDGESTDRDLIERVLGGRQEAYAELVRRHHPRVFGLCVSMLGDRAQAEDAAQDVFLKAYRRLADFRGDAALSTWLYRVAANRCLDLLRRTTRRREESWEAFVEREGDGMKRLLAEPTAEAPLVSEDADLVRRVLARLPDEYRLILTLREVEGLDYRELTEALDCSMDSVKAKLRRARQRFREILGHIESSENV